MVHLPDSAATAAPAGTPGPIMPLFARAKGTKWYPEGSLECFPKGYGIPDEVVSRRDTGFPYIIKDEIVPGLPVTSRKFPHGLLYDNLRLLSYRTAYFRNRMDYYTIIFVCKSGFGEKGKEL